jgi:hypothetical protein
MGLIEEDRSMKEVELSQGKMALVDDEDYDNVIKHVWSVSRARNTWYAVTTIYYGDLKTSISLHRFILAPPDDAIVDHRDRNGLNCQRRNMRLATLSQSMMNRYVPQSEHGTGFRGIEKNKNKWTARIRADNERTNLGTYDTPEEAARAYDRAAMELHGEFAVLNFEYTVSCFSNTGPIAA